MALLLICILLALAAGVGRRILLLLRATPEPAGERLVYSIALGLGAIAYLVLLLGLLGLLRAAWVCTGIAGLAAICARGFVESFRDLYVRPDRKPDGSRRERLLVAGTIAVLVILAAPSLVSCFVPPGAHEWDVLSYHLAAPKVYIAHHRILYLPTDHHSNFPFLLQMLYCVGLLLSGYALANLVHFSTTALAVVALLLIGRRRFGAVGGVVAALSFASAPIVLWEAGIAYIDAGFACYTLLAIATALDFVANRRPGTAALSGCLIGLALGVKALAVVPFALLAILLAAHRCGRPSLVRFLVCAALVGAPFYVKSWVLTGNPVYPFAYGVFGGRNWNAHLANQYAGSQQAFGMGSRAPSPSDDLVLKAADYVRVTVADRVRGAVLAPFALVATPRIFYDYNDPGQFSHAGFLFLALPALLVFAGRAPPATRFLVVLAALWYLSWAFSMQYVRYLLPVLPILALIGGDAVARLARSRPALAWTAVLAVTAQVGLALSFAHPRLADQWARATNGAVREEYLVGQINSYAAEQWIDSSTTPDAGVILYEEARGFYLDRPYLWGNRGHSTYIPYDRFLTGADMATWFLAHGYRYALLNLQFSPFANSAQGIARLREAVALDAVPDLVREWYRPDLHDEETWRPLLGDAIRSGVARFVPEGTTHGVALLEFVRPSD